MNHVNDMINKNLLPLKRQARTDADQPTPASDRSPLNAAVPLPEQLPGSQVTGVLRSLMIYTINELGVARGCRDQQRCLAFLNALLCRLRRGAASEPVAAEVDLLEELARRLAAVGHRLRRSSRRKALQLTRQVTADWAAAIIRDPAQGGGKLAPRVYGLLRAGVPASMLIPAAAAALGDAGLLEVEDHLWQDDFRGPAQQDALLQVAMALNDVHEMASVVEGITEFGAGGLDIAERLLRADMPDQALDCLSYMDVPRHERERKIDLEIAACDRLYQPFQEEKRWECFAETLSRRHFDGYLAQIPSDEHGAARQRAIRLAQIHPDVHAAILFLYDIDERRKAMRLCAENMDKLAAGKPDAVLQLVEKLALDDEELSERLVPIGHRCRCN